MKSIFLDNCAIISTAALKVHMNCLIKSKLSIQFTMLCSLVRIFIIGKQFNKNFNSTSNQLIM